MNENLNLVELLKDCPKGTKLYSTVFGEVEYDKIDNISLERPIVVSYSDGFERFTKDGRLFYRCDGECTLFPSREQRDWNKFKVKQPKFNPKTLCPFDKVLARDTEDTRWRCTFYSHSREPEEGFIVPHNYVTTDNSYICCIPYNNDTKHLVGTKDEAPEFYRYWED